MASKEIDNLEAGREMDTLVAEKVMEWHQDGGPFWIRADKTQVLGWTVDPLPRGWENASMSDRFRPSTSISAAFEMEGVLSEMDGHIQVGYVSRLYEILDIPFGRVMTTGNTIKLIRATPEQRCRAALKAVMK